MRFCCVCALQMGVNNTELWNNLGLCCFYASQVRMRIESKLLLI